MRVGSGRWAATVGTARSAPVASCQAMLTGLAAARFAAGEAVAQRGCLQGGYRHALPVDRVEAADRVPDDQKPGGELAQPLVAPPQAGREPVGADLGERFGVADRGEDVRWGHGAGEGEEPVFVGRRVVAGVSGQRQDPAVCLLQEQCHPDRRLPGLTADKDQLFVPEDPGGQP
jgi:hypothetical protein